MLFSGVGHKQSGRPNVVTLCSVFKMAYHDELGGLEKWGGGGGVRLEN